jgi:hypothetical protein
MIKIKTVTTKTSVIECDHCGETSDQTINGFFTVNFLYAAIKNGERNHEPSLDFIDVCNSCFNNFVVPFADQMRHR